ncbi:MAG: TrpB-like pyridoxal phosphate-dependent enzyme [Deltaproteobacteria bacterium]|jgi:pyridoxal-phosphate dependent TrpB-like enzyme|nr:TrpB-like pyridoxal phosphate-dependent enzyme [Deltaproteobacteria bacterium]
MLLSMIMLSHLSPTFSLVINYEELMTLTENKIILPKSELPTSWYNVLPDLPEPIGPYLNEAGHTVLPADLVAIFPNSLIEQEISGLTLHNIPEPVLQALSIWRPTPLIRARRLEKILGVNSRIYYKDESVSPSGSHKSNTAMAQAYFNKREGITRLTTETGAGQWGTAIAIAAKHFGIQARVYMVKVSLEQKPYRKIIMNLMGAEVFASPSSETKVGRTALEQNPKALGTLGLAISEAVEEAASNPGTNYVLGSVLNHVVLHQTVIGQEVKKQLAIAGEKPEYLIGCHGGGSNFGGLVAPFVKDILSGQKITAVAVEPESCPTLTKGEFKYDAGDTAGFTPLMPMYSLGKDFQPPAIHAGGLRYHGASPIVSALLKSKVIQAAAVSSKDCFKFAQMMACSEYVIPAPESAHALAKTCLLALELERQGRPGCLVFTLSGHGLLDLTAYQASQNL